MKRGKLLNAPLSALVAQMGHTDEITVCDAGLPIAAGPERIADGPNRRDHSLRCGPAHCGRA